MQYFIINILVSFFYRPISLWFQTRSAHLINVKVSQGLARNRLIEMSEHYFCCGLGITLRTLTLHNCKTWAPAQKKKKKTIGLESSEPAIFLNRKWIKIWLRPFISSVLLPLSYFGWFLIFSKWLSWLICHSDPLGLGYEICFLFLPTFLDVLNNMDYTINYILYIPSTDNFKKTRCPSYSTVSSFIQLYRYWLLAAT